MRKQTLRVLISLSILYPAISFAAGYTPRPCGFDLNRNGIVGEPADCHVCDGVTADPDGDGTNEHLIYTDSYTGNDTTGNGYPGTPYKTITKALSMAHGPRKGVEDIICIHGTFTGEKLTLPVSGVAGYYTRDGFQFPSNPLMIVGWDKNQNGQYPPFDAADEAIIDGQGMNGIAISNVANKVSYFEIAHLTIQNYHQGSAIRWTGNGSGTQSHMYMHDVEMRSINEGDANNSDYISTSFWSSSNSLSYVAIINSLADKFGSYFARGSPSSGGHYRFQNLTLKMKGPNGGTVAGIKLWDMHSGVEILDNIIDANINAWTSAGTANYAIAAAQCTQDWIIRGNTFIDVRIPIVLQPFATGYCTVRPLDNIVIDRNKFTLTTDYWRRNFPYSQPLGLRIEGGPTRANTVKNVRITNNFFYSADGWEACIRSDAGNNEGTQPGTITIAGNSCRGPFNRSGYHGISITAGGTFPQNNYVFKDNIVANTRGNNRNVGVTFAPSNWVADGNVYDNTTGFVWNNVTKSNFAAWQAASKQDANSKPCSPSFVDSSVGDLHLLNSDTCAKNSGVDITAITTVDIDGQPRPASGSDSGADEIIEGQGQRPRPPTGLRVF